MHEGATTLLRHHQVFASKNLDETRAFMHNKEFLLDVHPRDAGELDMVARAAYLPGSYIGYIHYGPAVSVSLPADRKRNDFFIHFPLRGNFEVTNKAGSIACSPTRSAVSSPDGHVTRSEAGSARVTLSVSKTTAMTQLAALTRGLAGSAAGVSAGIRSRRAVWPPARPSCVPRHRRSR